MKLIRTRHPQRFTPLEMDKLDFDLSLKNIPIPPKRTYMKQLIDKTDNFLSRVRRKTDIFLNPGNYQNPKPSYGFKSTSAPPASPLLKPFEDELFDLIANLNFNEYRTAFQTNMADTVKKIKESQNIFLLGDKTTNIYEVSPDLYEQLLLDNVTKDYVQVTNSKIQKVNDEAKNIVTGLGIADRVEVMSQSEAFITLKDHKANFETERKCRLINPAKSQIGILSRQILQRANKKLRDELKLNQWQSTQDVLQWFKNINNKGRKAFMQWDICEFYPSISAELLKKAIILANDNNVEITNEESEIIMHARKAFLFSQSDNGDKIAWQKRECDFDVTMGAPDGAEVCELVGIFLLNEISKQFPKLNFGLYRDDGLATHSRMPKRELEKTRQKLRDLFQTHGLKIIFEQPHDLKEVNFLDVTLNLTNESFRPYRKPNDKPLYVHVDSNHPASVIKQIPLGINKRLVNISSTQDDFNRAAPAYQKALNDSGHKHKLQMPTENNQNNRPNVNRDKKRTKREIIYYTPPFNKALKTNLGRIFLDLVRKHFPKNHKLYPILNKNTLKISYSCTANIKMIIQAHNRKILQNRKRNAAKVKPCNCQTSKKDNCPLRGHCNQTNVIYKATTPAPNPHFYVGVTENFKARWGTHKQTFKKPDLKNATGLSTFVWDHSLGEEPDLRWDIIDRAPTYQPGLKSCQLCLTEKLHILMESKKHNCLNKRSEICYLCRHKAHYRLGRVKSPT